MPKPFSLEAGVGNCSHQRYRPQSAGGKPRAGVATMELAVCLPMIVTIVFASVELSSMIFLKLALQTCAYDAARVAATPSGSSADAINHGNTLLDQRGVKQGNVQVTPSNLQNVAAGDPITVTVTAPASANRMLGQMFFLDGNFSATCVMVKEGH